MYEIFSSKSVAIIQNPFDHLMNCKIILNENDTIVFVAYWFGIKMDTFNPYYMLQIHYFHTTFYITT